MRRPLHLPRQLPGLPPGPARRRGGRPHGGARALQQQGGPGRAHPARPHRRPRPVHHAGIRKLGRLHQVPLGRPEPAPGRRVRGQGPGPRVHAPGEPGPRRRSPRHRRPRTPPAHRRRPGDRRRTRNRRSLPRERRRGAGHRRLRMGQGTGRLDARLAAVHDVLAALEHRRRPADGPADRRPDPRHPGSLVGPDVGHRRHPRRAADRHPAALRAPGPRLAHGQPPRPPLRQRIPELQRPRPQPAVLGLRPEPDPQHPRARDRGPRLPGALRHPGPPGRPAHPRPT